MQGGPKSAYIQHQQYTYIYLGLYTSAIDVPTVLHALRLHALNPLVYNLPMTLPRTLGVLCIFGTRLILEGYITTY